MPMPTAITPTRMELRTHHEEREDVAPKRIGAQPVGGRRGCNLAAKSTS